MFHLREQNHIARAQKFSAPGLRNQVDAFRCPAGENDFVRAGGADVFRHALARFFVSFGRARTQLVQAAMDIRVVVFVIMPQRIGHRPRLLRRGRIIEIDKGFSLHAFAQDRKILADRCPIDTGSA